MLEPSRLPAIRQLGVIVTHAPQDEATPGVYEQVVALTGSDGVYQSQTQTRLQQRLQPVDTDSPRATLNGFLKRSLGPFTRAAAALSWRLPSTEIEIVEINEGDRQGEFLFSAGTVRTIRDA